MVSTDARDDPRAQSAPGAPVVMIVDDHAHFRSAMRHWIARLDARYESIEAASGEEAVALAARRKVDIVLMDMELPGIDGVKATRRIKANAPRTRVVMLTSHDASAFRDAAQEAGASAYVLKNRVPQDLESLLAAMLGTRECGSSPGARNGPGTPP